MQLDEKAYNKFYQVLSYKHDLSSGLKISFWKKKINIYF